MNKALNKLRAAAGETLVESLCAILLVVLATMALVAALNAAASINYQVREADDAFGAELSAAETSDAAAAVPGTITIKSYASPVTREELESDPPPAQTPEEESADVTFYSRSNTAGELRSYAVPEAEGGTV